MGTGFGAVSTEAPKEFRPRVYSVTCTTDRLQRKVKFIIRVGIRVCTAAGVDVLGPGGRGVPLVSEDPVQHVSEANVDLAELETGTDAVLGAVEAEAPVDLAFGKRTVVITADPVRDFGGLVGRHCEVSLVIALKD